MLELDIFCERITKDFSFEIFSREFVWQNLQFGILHVFLSPFADATPDGVQGITFIWQRI